MNCSRDLLYVLSAVTETIACFCLHCHFFIRLASYLPSKHQKSKFLSKTYEPIASQFWYPLCRYVCRYVLYLTLFTFRFLLLRKGNSLCAMMILGLLILYSSSKLSRRELIMSIAAVKELMLFFSYFQALQLKTNHTYDLAMLIEQIPILDLMELAKVKVQEPKWT